MIHHDTTLIYHDILRYLQSCIEKNPIPWGEGVGLGLTTSAFVVLPQTRASTVRCVGRASFNHVDHPPSDLSSRRDFRIGYVYCVRFGFACAVPCLPSCGRSRRKVLVCGYPVPPSASRSASGRQYARLRARLPHFSAPDVAKRKWKPNASQKTVSGRGAASLLACALEVSGGACMVMVYFSTPY